MSEQVSESVYPLWEREQQMVVFIFVGTCLTVFPLSSWLSEGCLCTFGRRMVSSLTCLASENGRGQFRRGIVS